MFFLYCNKNVISLHTERSVCVFMETTKEIIIEKAYHLFLSRGFGAVSVNDICVATGLSKGALYHHFSNKNELFKAVVDSTARKSKYLNTSK